MKVGDLVRWNRHPCMVTDVYESKIWRNWEHGTASPVDWGLLEPEPFARILFKGNLIGVPQTDLEPLP
jgi:hypothetical protein